MPDRVDWSNIHLTKDKMTPEAWAAFDRFTDELARIIVERGLHLAGRNTQAPDLPADKPAKIPA